MPKRQLCRGEPPEPAEAERGAEVAEVDPPPLVALAGEREHRVGADVHGAVDAAREVHTEERVGRIGHGIHERADEVGAGGHDLAVLAAERDHPHAVDGPGSAHRARDLVGVEAGAGDHPPRLDRAGRTSRPRSRRTSPGRRRGSIRGAGALRPASISFGERPADVGVVDDPRVEDVQGGDAGDVRLELTQPRRSDQVRAHAVRLAPALELREPAPVDLVGRDHDLAGDRMVDPVLAAVLDHRQTTRGAHAGLLRPGLVIDAGVDDAGVAPALVRADRRLLLDDHDGSRRLGAQDGPRGREPDDSSADDGDVRTFHPRTIGARMPRSPARRRPPQCWSRSAATRAFRASTPTPASGSDRLRTGRREPSVSTSTAVAGRRPEKLPTASVSSNR